MNITHDYDNPYPNYPLNNKALTQKVKYLENKVKQLEEKVSFLENSLEYQVEEDDHVAFYYMKDDHTLYM
jgi:regulator of replication initiation timing